MDYEVHINDGSAKADPIVLRLLPGEETIFELRIVNHGGPSNVLLEAGSPLTRAVRLKGADHYVSEEEIVPVLARMPKGVDRLDGHIDVISDDETIEVPMSLILDSGPQDLEDEGLGDEDHESEREILADEDDEEDSGEEPQEYQYAQCHRETPDEECSEGPAQIDPVEIRRPSYSARHRALRAKRESSWGDPAGDSRSREDAPIRAEQGEYSPEERPEEYRQEDPSEASYADFDDGDKSSLGFLADRSEVLSIPVVLMAVLIAVLLLTFYVSAVPELMGALVSSILIVTLIIYGAATLLKA